MTVAAVIFDWGGTLTPWHNIDLLAGWRAVAELVAPDLVEQTTAALARAERVCWERADTEHRSSTVHEVIELAGVAAPAELLERALEAYVERWDPHTHTGADVKALFGQLRDRGIRIGVLSNTQWPRAWHERIFARDGVLDLIDGDVYTSEIEWTKPHPEAFRAALRAVGLTGPDDPARAVFVGDRPIDDIQGAKAVGMRAVLVPHSTVPPSPVRPDAVVDRLADLLPVLDRWAAEESAG